MRKTKQISFLLVVLIVICIPGVELSQAQQESSKGFERSDEPDRSLIPVATKLLKEQDPNVRKRTVVLLQKLGQTGDGRAIELLIGVLKDTDTTVQRSAIEALMEIGTPAVPQLIMALRDRRRGVEAEVAIVLGSIRDDRAVDDLIQLLKSKERAVRTSAVLSLVEITGQSFGEDIAKWQEWWERKKPK